MKRIIIFLGIISMFFYAEAQTPKEQNGAKIEFKTTFHDFGNILKGNNAKCEFTFTNTGTEPLILSDVKPSCDCTVPAWPKQPILPGGKGTISVVYEADETGGMSKSIKVISNAVTPMVDIRIAGNVVD